VNIFSVVLIIILFKPIGNFADSYPAYITVPLAFTLRFLSIIFFLFLDTPDTMMSYLVCSSFLLSSYLEAVTLDGLFNKNMIKDIRGTLSSAYSFFGAFGTLIFTKAGGYMYDNIGH
jgi:hypothetical protein